jgi:anti-sigma regulatory factor (Ser/Thr protein kinase)
MSAKGEMKRLASIIVDGEIGSEREAARQVIEVLKLLALPPQQVERIRTAVCEAVLNAVEHGNNNRIDLPVHLLVESNDECVTISVYDHGLVRSLPESPTEPDLAAKLAGEQRPRGWGLFLIRNLSDQLQVRNEPARSCIVVKRSGMNGRYS